MTRNTSCVVLFIVVFILGYQQWSEGFYMGWWKNIQEYRTLGQVTKEAPTLTLPSPVVTTLNASDKQTNCTLGCSFLNKSVQFDPLS